MNENQQFLLYTAPDGALKVEVFLKDETVWLTQKALAEDSGISILETTAADGKHYLNETEYDVLRQRQDRE